MNHIRPLLKLRSAPQPAPDGRLALLREAISTRTYILATYNKGRVKLAPYVLYERDDALFLDAVTVDRDGRVPRELKLGAFRLSGLADVEPASEHFSPEFPFSQEEPRYKQGILARI